MSRPRPHLLAGRPDLPEQLVGRVRDDFARFAGSGIPRDVERYLLASYGLDVSASYAGVPLRNPWGKASGQLSMRRAQVEEAIDAGLVFAGTADDVWDQLRAFYNHVGGFGHLLMMGQGGHITHEDTVDNLALFSKEVLPRLTELG